MFSSSRSDSSSCPASEASIDHKMETEGDEDSQREFHQG